MATNATWHNAHRMPKNPTLRQRIDWHTAHQKQCACRPKPAKLATEMKAHGPMSGDVKLRQSS